MVQCRYCGCSVEEKDAVPTHSYWKGHPFISHRDCKVDGVKQEAYDCQVIDADCNDCRHFQRGQLISKDIWTGLCRKFNRNTRAYPNKWTGMPCFEHRRATPLL